MVKTKFSTFLDEKFQCSNLFSIFLKTGFSRVVLDCVTYDLPLNLSDRAQNFTTAPPDYSQEVESAVLFSHGSVRSYRVFHVKNRSLSKTFPYFCYLKKRK